MITIRSEQAMKEFGAKLGSLLNGSEVIELVGDVGAGKTTFVRGLAEGMGIEETVQSPSFTINRVYDAANNKRLSHYDFYRLEEVGIMANELDEAVHDSETVVVVEWANAVAAVLPDERLTLGIIASGESERNVEISAQGERALLLQKEIHDFTT
jgi:tRNA threonylcarbamoyladenosine biosynthesis protein TsaE